MSLTITWEWTAHKLCLFLDVREKQPPKNTTRLKRKQFAKYLSETAEQRKPVHLPFLVPGRLLYPESGELASVSKPTCCSHRKSTPF